MNNENKFKKTLIWLFIIALCFAGSVILKNIAFQDSPLSNHMTLEDLQTMNIRVSYIEDSEDWTDEWYDMYCDSQIEGAKTCEYILVGKPTGNIYFNRGTILQEIYVEYVIKGDCTYQKIWIQNGLKSTLKYKKGEVILSGMDRSLMQQDCEYLLFCDAMSANEYSDKKVYTEADAMWFGCYNLSRDSNIVMKQNEDLYNSQIEFYTSSDRTLELYNNTKHKLINKYIYEK